MIGAGCQWWKIDFKHTGVRAVHSAVALIDLLFRRIVDRDRTEGRFQLSIKPDRHLWRRNGDRPANSRVRTQRESMRLGESFEERLRPSSKAKDKLRTIFSNNLIWASAVGPITPPWRPGENIGPEIVDKDVDKSIYSGVFARNVVQR